MFEIEGTIKVHFIGIGGIGMSAIAEVLLRMGYRVSGSDSNDSEVITKLKKLGAKIYIGHSASNVTDSTIVIYSSAIKETNPEFKRATQLHLPLLRRAEMLAELMRLKHGLAIAGTHGKTTTTGLLATILSESGTDPTYIIGGIVKNLRGHARVGKGKVLLAEADESDGSFLFLNPIMAVITNIDLDHMSHYKSEKKLIEAFSQFANKVPFYGFCALNYHDKRLMKIKESMRRPCITFGTEDGASFNDVDFFAGNIVYDKLFSSFDLFYKGKFKVKVKISLPGQHNILNALGAIVLASFLKIDFYVIAKSLGKFKGINRRFQRLYSKNNVEIIDDYAHHPTEISSTLTALVRTRQDSKIIVFFEPHRFSRTQSCWNDFTSCFAEANQLFLLPIYAASEKEIKGINSSCLAREINKVTPRLAKETKDMREIVDLLKHRHNKKITIVTLGAGSIGKKIREIVDQFDT